MNVLRKGVTASEWSDDPSSPELSDSGRGSIEIEFNMPSKGGGITKVSIEIEPADFAELARKMFGANSGIAFDAFSSAIRAKLR